MRSSPTTFRSFVGCQYMRFLTISVWSGEAMFSSFFRLSVVCLFYKCVRWYSCLLIGRPLCYLRNKFQSLQYFKMAARSIFLYGNTLLKN
jgi:hypothetical protein